jgi:hypothetical protein
LPDPTVLIEIPAKAYEGILTLWGDNKGVYAVKFPDGRIIVADQRLETDAPEE